MISLKKLDPKIVASIITAIASVIVAIITGIFSIVAVHSNNLQIEKYQSEIAALESQINNQSTNSENKEKKPETFSTEISTENLENTKSDEKTQVNNTPNEIDEEEEQTKNNAPEMIAVANNAEPVQIDSTFLALLQRFRSVVINNSSDTRLLVP